MSEVRQYPFYLKFCLNLLTLVILGGLIYIGTDILMPLFFAIVLAILLLPLNNWLVRRRIPNVLAMMLSILIALLVITVVIYFLSSQVAGFMSDLPTIKKHLNDHWLTVQRWISKTFHYSKTEQIKAIEDATSNMKSSGTSVLGATLFTAVSALLYLVLIPIYTFLILYYRKLLKKFFTDIFVEKHQNSVQEVLNESKVIIQGYMIGLLLEMAIVAALNITGFFIIGIQYAVFLGVLAAIMNMIPYVGMLVATVICMLITLTTSTNIGDIIWVAVVLTTVQFIDNNLIMPYVVSSKVRINALASIIGVLIGGTLAGVSGMFLSIPGVAIIKTIFERIDGLKPWGMLMGDDTSMLNEKKRKRFGRADRKAVVKQAKDTKS